MIHIEVSDDQLETCKEIYFQWLKSLLTPQGQELRINNIIDYFNLPIADNSSFDLQDIEDGKSFLDIHKDEILDYAFKRDLENFTSPYSAGPVPFDLNNNNIHYIMNKVRYRGSRINHSKINYGRELYKKFRKSDLPFRLYKEVLGLLICPYCNKNSLEYIEGEEAIKSRMDIDHIKPQSKNPHLTINFYNLMPSCHTCNFMKGVQSYITLFDLSDTDFQFRLDLEEIDYSDIVDLYLSDNFKVKIQGLEGERDILELAERYNNEQPKIKSILNRQYWYNEYYLKLVNTTLKTLPSTSISSLQSSRNTVNIYKILELHFDEEDYYSYPYSKLTKDLLDHIYVITE